MPTFDIVSEVDRQEVRNAVDQAAREVATRYDFKGTNTTIRVGDDEIVCESSTDNRLDAAIGSYRRSLQADPGYVQTYSDLGGALVERGDVDEGIENLRRAIEGQDVRYLAARRSSPTARSVSQRAKAPQSAPSAAT